MAKAQPLDRARREILDEHVGFARHVEHQLLAGGRLEIDGDRLLVGVEDEEVEGIALGVRQDRATGVACVRVLDLDDLGTEPGQGLGAGWAGLELREIQHAHPAETVQGYLSCRHVVSPPIC